MDKIEILVKAMDARIAKAQLQFAESNRIADSLKNDEEHEDDYGQAYENCLEARLALIEAERLKRWVMSVIG